MTAPFDITIVRPELRANRDAGKPWIVAHTDVFKALGWTREEVLGIGRYAYPVGGDWGLIWSDTWRDPRLIKVVVEPDGAVAFHVGDAGKTSVMRRRPGAWRSGSNQHQTQPSLEAV